MKVMTAQKRKLREQYVQHSDLLVKGRGKTVWKIVKIKILLFEENEKIVKKEGRGLKIAE